MGKHIFARTGALFQQPTAVRPHLSWNSHTMTKSNFLRRRTTRLAIAWLLPLAACWLQWILWDYIKPVAWLLFIPAISAAPWIGGLWGGIGALLLSVALGWFFFAQPLYASMPANYGFHRSVVIILVTGLLFNLLYHHLLKYKARLKALIENSDGYIWSVDQKYRLLVINANAQRLWQSYGLRSLTPGAKCLPIPRQPEESAWWKALYDQAFAGKQISLERLFVFDKERILELQLSPIRENNGRVTGAVCQCRDITERKQMEEKLRISEARYRTLFGTIRYEVYSLDLDGRYREANTAFHEVWDSCFGRTIEEVMKDPEPAQCLKDLVAQVLKTRTAAQTSFSVHRDGHTLSYIATLSPVLTEDDQLIGLVGVNIDVTEQKAMYDDLRTMSMRMVDIQEQERRRIARDIHDSLGQHLTALQYELAAVLNSFAGQTAPPPALIDASNAIKELIKLVQNVCYDLRPSILDDFGLEVALQDYLNKYQGKWNFSVSFSAKDLDAIKGSSTETVLFRVAQEALTNIFKHAKARRVRIQVENRAGQVALSIEDDGCGFDPAAAKATSGSAHHGLRNMEERVRLHGGAFSIKSEPGKGTTLMAVLSPEIK